MWFVLLAACSENGLNSLDPDAGDGAPPTPDTSAPKITVDPPSIDFGAIVATASVQATVVVGNVGDGTLEIGDFHVNGGAPVRIAHEGQLDLDPGAETVLELTWSPGADIPLANDLVIGSNDPDRPKVKVPLTGTVLGPDVAIDPSSYDFGTLPRNVPVDEPITLTNLGAIPLHVSKVEYGGSSSELALYDDAGLSAGGTLGPGESKILTVRYTPTDGYSDEGTLHVFSDDEDTPEIDSTQVGTGDPSTDYETVLLLTADDSWEGWIDGKKLVAPNANGWSLSDTMKQTLSSGDHVIAIHAWDVARAISGVNGVFEVDKKVYSYTGDRSQVFVTTAPSATWTDVGFDDSKWSGAINCTNTSPWGGAPTDIVGLGGKWIWWTGTCENLGEAWFRWNVTLP
jgi:hypothetical protein